jgi:hypothetical protein
MTNANSVKVATRVTGFYNADAAYGFRVVWAP